ncbi:MAG: alpha-amylase [Planctomycetota bacterium]|jgi:starch synthase (maltosyl-transferring)|nr:alpha-amylase [Planctomycetota bacterium]
MNEAKTAARNIPFIYNLFPSLLGPVDKWLAHVERAVEMGFNWIFINPIHLTGASGSLYAIRDYFHFNPAFFPSDQFDAQKAQLAGFVAGCREMGAEVMVDLVINHTAYDNPLTRDHRDWYKQNADGTIKNPGARDDKAPGGYVVWGDLSEIDNAHSPDRGHLWDYWWSVVEMYQSCGVRGFRCDAAYQIPDEFWRFLIRRGKDRHAETRFFAESLGCPLEQTLALAASGHDYVFNSGKWWDYRQDWFIEQMRAGQGRLSSVCFPESHDTERLAGEWNRDLDRIKQHYLMTALISSGVLILMGFEYGFTKKPHVVHTHPHDYEGANYDLTDYIREVNSLKRGHRVFAEDNRLERVDSGHDGVIALKKTTLDGGESGVLLFNRTPEEQQIRLAELLGRMQSNPYRKTGAANVRVPDKAETLRLKRYGATVFRLY